MLFASGQRTEARLWGLIWFRALTSAYLRVARDPGEVSRPLGAGHGTLGFDQ